MRFRMVQATCPSCGTSLESNLSACCTLFVVILIGAGIVYLAIISIMDKWNM